MLMYAVWAFSIVFMLTAIFRVVEFKAVGLSLRARQYLIPLHIVGCLAFSASLVMLVTDVTQSYKPWTSAFFFTGVLILFPLHIYLAIKRKIQMTK
jgi:hypothetical protein